MVYFFSISHLASEDCQEVISALRKSHCPGIRAAAAAWYLERGGPWRVRFIYGAHYTVDLFAVSNPASQAFLELTSTVCVWGRGPLALLLVQLGGACDGCVSCVTITHVWRPSSQRTTLAWRLRGQGHLRTRSAASTRAWVHEMVDQRAHAVFVPFVTWSTNPQYLIPPGRTAGRSASSGDRDSSPAPAGLCWTWKEEHLQGLRCSRALCGKCELVSSGISFLGGLPGWEAVQIPGEGHAVCATAEDSSGPLTRVWARCFQHRSLGHHASVPRQSMGGGPLGSQPGLRAAEKGFPGREPDLRSLL